MPSVNTGKINIEYDEFGEGEALFLVMGISAQMVVWHPDFCHLLAERGFRVIRFDNRDTGKSTWLDQHRTPSVMKNLVRGLLHQQVDATYTLSDMACDVIGLLDALNIDRAHVVGASLGGMVAQHLAIEHPHRILSLTSIMSGPGTVRHMFGTIRAIRALLAPPPTTRSEAMDHNEALFQVIGGELPVDMGFIRERAAVSWDRGRNPSAFARQWAAMLASGSRIAALRRLTCPALVIHGNRDPLIPLRAGVATARAIPQARLDVIDGMGHELPRVVWPHVVDSITRHATAASATAPAHRSETPKGHKAIP